MTTYKARIKELEDEVEELTRQLDGLHKDYEDLSGLDEELSRLEKLVIKLEEEIEEKEEEIEDLDSKLSDAQYYEEKYLAIESFLIHQSVPQPSWTQQTRDELLTAMLDISQIKL